MLPFTTQIIEVVAAHYPPNLPTPGEAVSAVADEAARPTAAAPVADPDTGQAQTAGDANTQLAQQTAFPGVQVSLDMVTEACYCKNLLSVVLLSFHVCHSKFYTGFQIKRIVVHSHHCNFDIRQQVTDAVHQEKHC